MDYNEFLAQKRVTLQNSGFTISKQMINQKLFDFQIYAVRTALTKGRYALFEDCGLGKTFQQLEWARIVSEYTKKPILILAPLAVIGQTINEATKLNITVSENFTGNVHISNYEQLENIDCSVYSGVVLDESSILKNFEGAYRNLIIELFAHTPYKLACTATPSPNDPMELGNHAEFLNVMSRNQMLSMYFVHDGGETAKWRLKKHAVSDFWRWVSTWAIMVHKPSDIGFKDAGYDLPTLNYIEHKIQTEIRDNGMLFNSVAVSATNFNQELRLTIVQRTDDVINILKEKPNEQFIIWVKQNVEGEVLLAKCKLHGIDSVFEVKGNDNDDYKKEKLLGFGKGDFRILITKTKIASYGLNYQSCHNQIFASLDFSFEQLYQGIRRSYRFGQKEAVDIYMITTDTMTNVIESIKNKQKQFNIMQQEMQKAMNEVFNEDNGIKPIQVQEVKTDDYHIMRGDSCQLIETIESDSIGFSIFSPPFAELYTYSNHIEDMGNSKDYKEFLIHFNYIVKHLHRILWSGRNVAVHCMDLPIQKGKEGYIGLRDFSGMIIQAFQDAGFIYHSRVTIWKNPVTEMQRTKALGLLHKQIKKDASMSRVGIPDYLLIFRKDGEHLHPVTHQDKDHTKSDYLPVDLWQKYASPIWYDIDYGDTLNYSAGRDDKDEKHICPLQLETIRRSLHLWSNEGDSVYTPFLGIGSEVHEAVKLGRYGIGSELKESYFNLACTNINSAVLEKQKIKLF